MVLLVAVFFGIAAGLVYSKIRRKVWRPPYFQAVWLVLLGFLPQLIAIYLPFTRQYIPDQLASFSLVFSQSLLLLFAIANRRLPGMYLLLLGLGCNLLVILLNGGFMPLPVDTAAELWPDSELTTLRVGERVHFGSKDILLPGPQIVLPWLVDRFVSPDFVPIRFAYSFGDILISFGAFYLLARGDVPVNLSYEDELYENKTFSSSV